MTAPLVSWIAFSILQIAASTPKKVNDSPIAQTVSLPSSELDRKPCRNPLVNGKYRIGCGVTAPVVLSQIDPEYPEEARVKKLTTSGIVLSLTVGADGQPNDIHVKNSKVDTVAPIDRSAQHLLEDKMLEAVKHYKFKPATFQGKNVPVEINVEINIDPF